MKKLETVPVWIIYTVVLISLGLSVCSLIIANSDVRSDCELKYDYSKVIEFAGLLFTVMGVVFSLYFVIIGINASHKKDEMERIETDIKEKQSQIEKDIKKLEIDNLDTIYSHLISLASFIDSSKRRKKTVNSLRLSRARLAAKSVFLSSEIRIQRIIDLAELGDSSDIKDLDIIINDSKNNELLINFAKNIKQRIIDRLKNQTS